MKESEVDFTISKTFPSKLFSELQTLTFRNWFYPKRHIMGREFGKMLKTMSVVYFFVKVQLTKPLKRHFLDFAGLQTIRIFVPMQ